MKHSLLALFFIPAALHTSAQALEESISVEGRYEAEIIPMERIATYPLHYKTSMPVEELIYDLEPASLNFEPSFFPLPIADSAASPWRGYLDASIGSWLNASLQAGAWILPPSSSWSLGAWISHRSTSLWRPAAQDDRRFSLRRDYDEAIGLQTSHSFSDGRRFGASVDYNLHYFNYFTAPAAPSQTVNRLKAMASLISAPQASLQYDLNFSVSHFAWRSFPLRPQIAASGQELILEDEDMEVGSNGLYPSRETHLHLGLSLLRPFGEGEASTKGHISEEGAALDAVMDAVLTGHGRDYGQLTLTPSYRFVWSNLHVRLGVEAAFTLNAGTKADPYSFFHIAPKCLFYIPSRHLTWYLKVGGGSELATLDNLYQLTQWQSPYQLSTAPLFSPVDAALGFNGGPASGTLRGLEGGLEIGYRSINHLPLLGWFPSALATGGEEGLDLLMGNAGGSKVCGFSFRGRLGWSFPEVVKVELKGSYSPQGAQKGSFNGVDRPRWTAEGKVAFRPVRQLEIALGADWRGVRKLYLSDKQRTANDEMNSLNNSSLVPHPSSLVTNPSSLVPPSSFLVTNSSSLRLPDWFSLNASATWSLSERLSFGVEATNLTNRSNLLLPGVPTEGVSAAATLSLLF